MNKYEVLYIVASGLEESVYAEVADKLSATVVGLGGEVENVDRWGIKKLAYPINFKKEGYYVVMKFSAPATAIVEFERQMRLNDKIVRFLVTACK